MKNHLGQIPHLHVLRMHLVKDIFLFGAHKAVPFTAEGSVKQAYPLKNACPESRIPSSRVTLNKRSYFFSLIQIARYQLLGMERHPFRFFCLIQRDNRSSNGIYLFMLRHVFRDGAQIPCIH